MSAQPEPVPVTAERRPRLGFVGLGWIGRKRLDAIGESANVEIAALTDAVPDRAHAAAERFADACVARDLDDLLRRELDGVVIATPNALHTEQALACLERGLPVFCQKPLALTAADAIRVIETARTADCLLGVDFCYRHVQGMHELRRRLTTGDLGKILSIDLQFHNAYGPDKAWCSDRQLAGGGCVLDLGVHLLDLALWLQSAPQLQLTNVQLFERGRRVNAGERAIEDLALIEFRQAGGATLRLACSWHAHLGRGAAISMRLLGTQGGAYWCNVDGSFYDFHLDLAFGDAAQRIGAPPDDWGCRALQEWTSRLRRSCAFDPDILLAARGAALIDEIYRA